MEEKNSNPEEDLKKTRSSINKITSVYNKKNVVKSVREMTRSPVVSLNTKALAIDIASIATNSSNNSVIQPMVRIVNSYKLLKVGKLAITFKKNVIVLIVVAVVILILIIITLLIAAIAMIIDKIAFWN